MFLLLCRSFCSGRVPLIKFVGKRSLVPIAKSPVGTTTTTTAATTTATTTTTRNASSKTVQVSAMYGRPILTEEESFCVDSGGANKIW